jgi:hypothetical protein
VDANLNLDAPAAPGEQRLVRDFYRIRRGHDRQTGGTANWSSLCASCSSSTIYFRRAPAGVPIEPTTYCSEMNRTVPGDIVECSGYAERSAMTLQGMYDIAVMIDPREGVNDGAYR